MDTESDSEVVTCNGTYHPLDFDNFIRWACIKMGISVNPVIARIEQHDYSSSAISCRKGKATKTPIPTAHDKYDPVVSVMTIVSPTTKRMKPSMNTGDVIKMNCVYNSNNQLVQIKFCKNKKIPTCLLKVLAIAVPFHKHLIAIHIDGGLKHDPMIELCNIMAISNITEVILDNTMLENANVHMLLENNTDLKHLSLARCTLSDDLVEELASKLIYPLPASKTLCILNLSSNKITDIGAKYIGEALKINRQLSYLNLSGNMITDSGAESLLSSLVEFPMTEDELKNMKLRYLCYLKDVNNRVVEMDTKYVKKKVTKTVPTTKKSKIGETKADTQRTDLTGTTNDSKWFDTGDAAFKDPSFEDPFKSENLVIKEGITYCLGNNTLSYLSLAYNNLTYFGVKQLCAVLRTQRELNRQPKGLINVCIEGNNIPFCMELKEINAIIEAGLCNMNWKKRMTTKTSAR